MVGERTDEHEYSALSEFIDLITSNGEHFRAYTAFFVVTTYESLAESGDERADFFKTVAKARRKLLVELDSELLYVYNEIEVAFNGLGVDLKDARGVLNKIRSDERVKKMRELDPENGGMEPSAN